MTKDNKKSLPGFEKFLEKMASSASEKEKKQLERYYEKALTEKIVYDVIGALDEETQKKFLTHIQKKDATMESIDEFLAVYLPDYKERVQSSVEDFERELEEELNQ